MLRRLHFIFVLFIFALLWPFRAAQAGQPGANIPAQSPEQPGDLDPFFGGFGSDGTISVDFGSGDGEIQALVAQPWDGKLVAVGFANPGFAVSRFLADGDFDPSFGHDGKVTVSFNGQSAFGYGVALQPDGKILVAGKAVDGGDFDFALARLNPDGSLDNSFSGDGKVTTGFGGEDGAYAVAIQSDGKIIAAGDNDDCGLFSCDDDFALARYTPDGELDTSFDSDGKATAGLGSDDVANAIAIQDDGKIVVGGFHTGSASGPAIARFLSNGSLDKTLDGDGLLSPGIISSESDMIVQPDHKIIIAGEEGVLRLESDGTRDLSFAENGIFWTNYTTLIGSRKLALLPNGKIIVAGVYSDPNEWIKGDLYDFGLVRLDASGRLDKSFGAGTGLVHNDVGPNNSLNIESLDTAIALPDGELVAAGAVQTTRNGVKKYALARYLPDGTLAVPGLVLTKVTDFEGIDDQAFSLAILPDRGLVAAGSADTGPAKRVGVASYTPRGLLDDSFGDHGLVRSGVAGMARAVALDSGGNILIAASRFSQDTGFDFTLLKFKSDGSTLAAGFGPDGNGFAATDLGGTDTANALARLPGGGYAVAGSSGLDFGLVRYTADGLPDTNFDQDGIVTTSFGPGSVNVANAVLGQPDGKILVAGRSKASGSENDDFALARYNPDGSLDATFDGDGLATVDLAGESDSAYDLALQPDGKILVAGIASVTGSQQMAAVRLNADGSLDTTFGKNGKTLIHTGFADNNAFALQLLPSGKVALAGCAANLDLGRNDMALALLQPDGQPDPGFSNDGIETYALGGDSCARDLAYDGQRLVLAGYASNGAHDNYALVGVVLLATRNVKFHQTFLPAIRK
jgi:uncharacterized delta-60 repeat protein